MPVKKRQKSKKIKVSLSCEGIEFVVQKKPRTGLMNMQLRRFNEDQGSKEMEQRIQIVSLWVDQQSGNAIKAHLFPNRSDAMHRNFVADLQEIGTMSVLGEFYLHTDGHWIRYGKTRDFVAYDSEHSENAITYDSKAKALADILSHIQNRRTLGGLNLISLNRLPDSLLLECGYEKIPDLMGNGIPMWRGIPRKILGQEWGAEADRTRKNFLDLLNKALS